MVDPSGMLPVPQTAKMQLLQKSAVILTKAALSAVPLAVLAFDIGQAGVDFANARLVERLLDGIGNRIEQLEEEQKQRLRTDQIYQLSGQAALRRMLTEINPRMADALARAVAELGCCGLSDTERLELARALDALTEPSLHLLQTFYRNELSLLTDREKVYLNEYASEGSQFGGIVTNSMALVSWSGPLTALQNAGLVQTVFDGNEDPDVNMVPREIYPLGERVLRLCFDDPAIPMFGTFAALPDAEHEAAAPEPS